MAKDQLAMGWLSACASSSADIAPAYVSPMQYQSYDCRQVAEEAQRVSNEARRAAGVQDENATSDAVVTGVAWLSFGLRR